MFIYAIYSYSSNIYFGTVAQNRQDGFDMCWEINRHF